MKPVPTGEGLVTRRVRLRRKEDVYVLGGIAQNQIGALPSAALTVIPNSRWHN